MNIGEAIESMRAGNKLSRPSWETRYPGAAIWIVPPTEDMVEHIRLHWDGLTMPWTPLSLDLLASDYEVFHGGE